MARLTWITTMSLLLSTACVTTEGGGSDPEIPGVGETPNPVDQPAERCGERGAPDASVEELELNARADLEVGTTLLGALSDEHDNVLVSPYSLRTAFGQVYAGTQGDSRPEIESILGFEALGDRTHAVLDAATQALESRNAEGTEERPELIVRPVNRSFFDTSFEDSIGEDWLETVQTSYGTCIEVFDLNADHEATLERVNGWVSDQTNDLIPNLVKSLPEEVSLIVVNALYFKAAWGVPFEASLTEDADFTTRSGARAGVKMMRAPLHQGRYAEQDGWQAVSLPYSDGRLEMVVILPAAGTDAAFEASLDADVLESVLADLQHATIDLRLPRFDLTSTWGLRPALESLGMQAAFQNGEDFSPIAAGMLPIFEVFHDVAIAIDEKGTEAAAATAVVFGEDGGGEEPVAEATMIVDHTFYLAIRDSQAGAVLFLARIGDPTGG
jgi:serpin B